MSWSAFSVSTNVGPQDMDQVPRQVYSCRLSTRTTSLLRQAETHIGRRPLGKSCSGKFEMTPFHTYWAATAREGGGGGISCHVKSAYNQALGHRYKSPWPASARRGEKTRKRTTDLIYEGPKSGISRPGLCAGT